MYTKIPIWLVLCAYLFVSGACADGIAYLPKISGHRGASFIAPENTLASIDSCIKYRIDLAECDVRISKDSVFYLLHDSTLDRTTNGAGDISNWMSQDIDTLDAGGWFNDTFRGTRVPRLADVLRRAKKGGLELTIDYRSGDMGKLLELIRAAGMLEHCTFVFSSEDELILFRTHAPEVKRLQAYIRQVADFERIANDLQPDIAVIWLDSLTPEMVSRCHAVGMKVLALALETTTPDGDYRRAIHLGIDILATDRPEYIAKKFRKE